MKHLIIKIFTVLATGAMLLTTAVGCEKEKTETPNTPQEQNVLKGTKWDGAYGRQGEWPWTDDNGEEHICHWRKSYFVKIDFATDSNVSYSIRIYESNDGPYGDGSPHLYGDYTYHSTYTFAGDTGHFYGGGDDSYNNAAIRLVNTDSIEIETTYGWKGFSKE